MDDEIFIEKCCSKCDCISWDSQTGFYKDPCKHGGSCDNEGRRIETDNKGKIRMFDSTGNDITSDEAP